MKFLLLLAVITIAAIPMSVAQGNNHHSTEGPASKGEAQADLLSRKISMHNMPSVGVEECVFQLAKITQYLSRLDQLDKDMLYLRAAIYAPAEFAAHGTETEPSIPYAKLIPEKGRTRLQTIIKSRIGCSQSSLDK
jgi:hypothetical protein